MMPPPSTSQETVPPLTSHLTLNSLPSMAVWLVAVSVNLSGSEMTVRTIRLGGIYNWGLNGDLMGAC